MHDLLSYSIFVLNVNFTLMSSFPERNKIKKKKVDHHHHHNSSSKLHTFLSTYNMTFDPFFNLHPHTPLNSIIISLSSSRFDSLRYSTGFVILF